MCLYTSNIKPLKADKNLTVIKCIKNVGGNYVTPAQNISIELGKTLTAQGDIAKLPEDYSDNNINGGVIHAYINPDVVTQKGFEDYVFVKGEIEAGTDFYVQFDGKEIAATEIKLTETLISHENINDFISEIEVTRQTVCNLLRDMFIENNDETDSENNIVKIGDVLLSDKKTFISPKQITSDKEIIGVVSYIGEDGKPLIIGLHQNELQWRTISSEETVTDISAYNDACNSFKGQEYTTKLKEKFTSNLEQFPALNYCLNYETEGTNKGDWFFPSTGEVLQIVRYAFVVNTTINRIRDVFDENYAEPIEYDTYFWTSAEYGSFGAWCCSTSYDYLSGWGWDYKLGSLYVRPALVIA